MKNVKHGGAKKTVLVVEDDAFLSDVYKHILLKEGLGVRIASDGTEALKAIETQAPDVLTLDLIMPGMSGFDVLETLSQKGKIPFPVIVLSNLGQVEDQERVKKLGAKTYLVKTAVSIDEVVAEIKKQLK